MDKSLAIINSKPMMSSLDLAKMVNKKHFTVIRDITNCLKTLAAVSQYNFVLGSYKDSQGQERPMYNLTQKAILLITSKYNVNLRMMIIDKVEELTAQLAQPVQLNLPVVNNVIKSINHASEDFGIRNAKNFNKLNNYVYSLLGELQSRAKNPKELIQMKFRHKEIEDELEDMREDNFQSRLYLQRNLNKIEEVLQDKTLLLDDKLSVTH
jgi:Rha family phage regulatory protein